MNEATCTDEGPINQVTKSNEAGARNKMDKHNGFIVKRGCNEFKTAHEKSDTREKIGTQEA